MNRFPICYEQFVERVQEGYEIILFPATHSEPAEVRYFMQFLPRRYKVAYYFSDLLYWMVVIGSICASIYYKWWAFIIGVLVMMLLIYPAQKKSGREFILQHAVENREFFEMLMEHKAIKIRC